MYDLLVVDHSQVHFEQSPILGGLGHQQERGRNLKEKWNKLQINDMI